MSDSGPDLPTDWRGAAPATAVVEPADREPGSVAAIVHDMRNSVAAIRNACHLLTLARDDVTAGRVAGIVARQSDRLLAMVDELAGRPRIS
jgi:nitrogen-specific signal transduction histidine kinase